MRIWCVMRSLFKAACRQGAKPWIICFFTAVVFFCAFYLREAAAQTQRFIKHGDGIMRFITVNSPFPAVYMFEMPPAWAPESVPPGAVDGSWYGKRIKEDAWIKIIPFDNSAGLKAEDIAKLVKKQYFNDGECSLDDFHKDTVYVSSSAYPCEAYFYEKCPPGKVNFFVICDVGALQAVIFNLSCRGEVREDLNGYMEDLDRIMRRFQWQEK